MGPTVWTTLADESAVKGTMVALKKNNITAHFTKTEEEARQKVFSLLPEGAQVMTMTSVTLDALGITKEINESGTWDSVRKKLASMDRTKDGTMMQMLGAAPAWVVGSVHAVTMDGRVMIASNTGSQLGAYAYGAAHVIWVVGTQKIVKDLDHGMRRIHEHSLPLESERAKKAYGVEGSNVSKMLIVNEEVQPGRIHMVFVNQVLGF